ncbi:MAG: tyrosine-type recombinase/integrase [Methylocella sp.]
MPELQAAIDAGPCGNLTFLVTAHGKPFTTAGFGNRMRKWCDAAGLKDCSAHGLRKAGACIAAENGATEAQLMAIFGWSDPDMAVLYTKKARQKRIAGDAMRLLVRKEREEQ